ncbi:MULTISPECIES: PspC domain-containing protein [unclassified Streptococcus]|uniref:PspC domain-containing protein n=1 Tax=unclassified Streptococcus TaxID=2608887 RepID=UPI0011B76837|nr:MULTISPECIES: PspC domain-containing protein [unclassified Streptococcus]TWS94187.1 PspC domain-containing protein [Streptococcus sp. sy018]TWT14706.1 PspC domain-containing protein [Streptococcus sp. sy010]
MTSEFYRLRQGKLVAGVVAGLADKFGWDLTWARLLIGLFIYFTGFGWLIYILLALTLPYKQEKEEMYWQGSRQRKEAKPVEDD